MAPDAWGIASPNVHTWLTHGKAFYTFPATVISIFTVLLSYPRSYWFPQASSPLKVAASSVSDPRAQLTLRVVFGGPLVVFDSLPHDVLWLNSASAQAQLTSAYFAFLANTQN